MFGRRPEGKRVKHLDPIVQITPYLMPWRCDAQVFLSYDAEYEPLLRYMSHKSREGVKITFMELIIAAFVRAISQVPEANRFIMNRKFYNRTELAVSFVVLRPTEDGQPEENAVKVKFDPSDTIFEVSTRVKQTIEEGRRTDDDSAAIKLASALLKVPLLPNLVVHVANFLDHHDLFPKALMDALPFHTSLFVTNMASIGMTRVYHHIYNKALMDALPFHTSLFVTNMASIGMTRVYHHIYNFGDTTMFLSLGCPERSHAVDATGKVFRKCTLPMGMTVDERICGGAVYARLFASMKHYLKHPEELEAPPDRVYYNEGAEYHVPKPDNVALPHSVTLNA